MPSDKAGRVIFIGNIPYGLSEEQITDLCRSAGSVINFRLVYDKETQKPKGFGFAEFRDADAAASAVRNLNGYDVMGRTLRVDYSNESGSGEGNTAEAQTNGADGAANAAAAAAAAAAASAATAGQGNLPPPVPPGIDLPPNLSAPDAISRTLNSIPPPQLLDILSQMKGVATSDPGKAAELFRSNPQLSYAIFQALLLLGLVDANVLSNVVGAAQAQPPAPAPPAMQAQHNFAAPPHMPLPMHMQQPPNVPTPPMSGPFGAAAPPPPPQPDLAALKQQVMAMQQHQIDAMPPAQREQIMNLRQRIMAGLL